MKGKHGTNIDNVHSIQEGNFVESKGSNHWFGEGVYFFVEGVNYNPTDLLASYWAIDQSQQGTKYQEYSVLEANICVDDDLQFDMCSNDGLALFNEVREDLLVKLKSQNKKLKKSLTDSTVLELMREKMNIELVKGNVYIRFRELRIQQVRSNIPNCTIICVKNPNKNVDLTSIQSVLNKKIH